MAVTRERAKTVGKDSPAIQRKAMLVSRCGGNDAAQTVWLQDACDLEDRFPKKFRVLKGLPGDEDVDAFCFQLTPMIGVTQNQIDILARREIDPDVVPGRLREDLTIRTIVITAAQVNDGEGFLA